MTLNEKEILSMLKYVNESDYGYLNLEDGDFELTVVKKGMDLSDIKDIIGNKNDTNGAANRVATVHPQEVVGNNSAAESQVTQEVAPSTLEQPKEEIKTDENTFTVRAPMVGTFFSKPSPEEEEYVKVGDTVSAGDTVCLIEVMKLFNSVPAGTNGRIEEVFVSDGELVEYDQPLFLIKKMNAEGSAK
ncbi:acetyl-CoA carboxylase biotin carboxyl carrier protein [Pseudogracilibacillus auburnensis]|uniref:acetyl-CoA carboxylase biotin carboxyl carrier protein n=1 Tax=Pseudogracilibacillus auburnensis TaxID=1494959 RepID=UPI001A970E72|nr:acetyl-CoA carboxylase biotin carboxyl carrier protein [Pseudogracilibacillus auburnensis]MBO1001847.1 acetyl-CoA carboxylase biotin carboxyl carrier protein [Pseudogracilibacillus auburnensis]